MGVVVHVHVCVCWCIVTYGLSEHSLRTTVLIEGETASTPAISSSSSEDFVGNGMTLTKNTPNDHTYQLEILHNQSFKEMVVF